MAYFSSACIERLVRQTVDLAAWVAELRVVAYSLPFGQNLALRRKLSTIDSGVRTVRVATVH